MEIIFDYAVREVQLGDYPSSEAKERKIPKDSSKNKENLYKKPEFKENWRKYLQ